MQLSVVILNYNVRYFLELCLKSVTEALKGLEAEIIVVDNFSTDESCKMVKSKFPEVILIENKENFGFSKGNNIGVATAQGDYVCILNPDTMVAEDTFKILLDFAQSKSKLGILGCKLVDGKGHYLQESKRNVPTPIVSVKKILGNSKPYYANHLGENQTGEVDILVGAFMLMKRSIYNSLNGFDEDYFMYGDDMDFSYRVSKAGYQNYYNPSTTIIHFKGESTLKDKVYAKRFNEAMQIFFRKHFKPNFFYNAIIWSGIKAITLINPQPKEKKSVVKKYVFVSDKENENLKSRLTKPIRLSTKDIQPSDHEEIIFDNGVLTFKTIIEQMCLLNTNADVTFKILPKNAQFIIGSNSSKGRGEIIEF